MDFGSRESPQVRDFVFRRLNEKLIAEACQRDEETRQLCGTPRRLGDEKPQTDTMLAVLHELLKAATDQKASDLRSYCGTTFGMKHSPAGMHQRSRLCLPVTGRSTTAKMVASN